MLENAYLLPWYRFMAVMSFLWGTCIGSYLNVCIFRIPRELSTVQPRSFCPNCKKQIPWYLNIPVISYFLLGGKCKFCNKNISTRYALVEILVGVLFLLVWLKFRIDGAPSCLGLIRITDPKLIPVYWIMVSGLVLGTFIDFEHLIIPDRVTLGGIVAGLLLSAIVPSMHNTTLILTSITRSAIGAALGWGLLGGVAVAGKAVFKKDAMGFGDVKLLSAMGAFLGWRAVLFTVMLSSLIGSIAGISLVLAGKRELQGRIPYGPYLSLAAILWILWGQTWWQLYINLISPAPVFPM